MAFYLLWICIIHMHIRKAQLLCTVYQYVPIHKQDFKSVAFNLICQCCKMVKSAKATRKCNPYCVFSLFSSYFKFCFVYFYLFFHLEAKYAYAHRRTLIVVFGKSVFLIDTGGSLAVPEIQDDGRQ